MLKDFFSFSGSLEFVNTMHVAFGPDVLKAQHLRLTAVCPVEEKDLSGFGIHEEPQGDRWGHADVDHEKAHGIVARNKQNAAAVAGLYWFPTAQYPAGRIEIGTGFSRDTQRAIAMAEAAHAIDINSPDWNDTKRGRVYDAYHAGQGLPPVGPISLDYQGSPAHPHGWFGPQDYFDTPGESWMIGFILGATILAHGDWWTHVTTPEVVAVVKRELGLDAPAGMAVWQIKGYRKAHRNASTGTTTDDCYYVRRARSYGRTLIQHESLAAAQATGLTACLICKPGG